jgi:hypothetical protein
MSGDEATKGEDWGWQRSGCGKDAGCPLPGEMKGVQRVTGRSNARQTVNFILNRR